MSFERGPTILLARTDRGLLRASNQDAAYTAGTAAGDIVLAVADGMGGAPAGERAASLVIAACETVPERNDPPDEWLLARVEAARAALEADQRDTPAHKGMGSTVVLALVREGVAWLAHAGDSRAYAWSPDGLERLTSDHNVAAERVRDGRLSSEAAMYDAGRHLLTRAVLAREARAELSGPHHLHEQGVLLLVSDGITGTLDDSEIASLIEANRGQDLVEALVGAAHDRGAPDNVAIALFDGRC